MQWYLLQCNGISCKYIVSLSLHFFHFITLYFKLLLKTPIFSMMFPMEVKDDNMLLKWLLIHWKLQLDAF